MVSAMVVRTGLTSAATELDRVLAIVSTADDHAQQLHAGFVDLGVIDLPVMVDGLRQRLADVTKQVTSAQQTLRDCADEVQRVIIGTGEDRAPDPAPGVDDTPKTNRPAHRFD